MLKKVGLLALLLCGGMFLHPVAAHAQEYRGWNNNGPYRGGEQHYYRDGDRFRDRHQEHEWREHEWREERQERQERAWRGHEFREHERRENGWYGAPYGPGPRAYFGYGYGY